MVKSKNICFYPKLTDDLFESIYDAENSNWNFNYIVNDTINSIDYIDNNGNISFEDSTNWNCDDYDLNITINIKLRNLYKLFGIEGIAPKNSKIGLCIEWYSTQAKVRNVINCDEFISNTDDEKLFTFEFTFPRQTFNGQVSINALLYLAKSDDKISKEELILNNCVGVLIGDIFNKIIFMTGDGSQFPIKVIPIPDSKLLWKLELNLDDPSTRLVSDGITLILNSAHKDYKFINPNANEYCERLADEIVTNAIVLFLSELAKSPEFDLNEDYESGTLLAYAKYCKERLNINFDGFMNISNSMHEFSERGE